MVTAEAARRRKIERALSERARTRWEDEIANMLTIRKQKGQRVVELYYEGKTVRQIAKEVHMSFRDIGAFIRAADEETGPESQLERANLSKDNQAIALFSEGKKPIEVTVALDLKIPDVERLYKDYLRLSGLGKLTLLYEEFKHSLPAFLKLYDNLKREKKVSNKDIESIINCSREIPWLKIKHQKLHSNVEDLEKRRLVLLMGLRTLQETFSELKYATEKAKMVYLTDDMR